MKDRASIDGRYDETETPPRRFSEREARLDFDAVMREHLRLVYAAACRQVGAVRAEDVTQTVFLLLWERWRRIPRGAVAGWLVKATRLAALQDNRAELRRRRREHRAASLSTFMRGPSMEPSQLDLSAHIDEALASLSEKERSAIVLRYLQDKSVAETAAIVGTSEAAVAKRLSRGLEHIRSWLGRRGHAIPLTALMPALSELGRSVSPPQALMGRITSRIASGVGAGPVTAGGAAGMLLVKKLTAIAAALLIVGGAWVALQRTHSSDAARAQSSASRPASQPASQPATDKPIKVGVTVSAWTAETNSPSGQPWGYPRQTRITALLVASDVELFPIIEPGSALKMEQTTQIQRAFPDRPVIDGSDPEALRQLDVIVAHENWMVPDNVLAAFEKAVEQGVSLLNIGGMGWATPGIRGTSPIPARLAGLTEGQGGSIPGAPVVCDVLLAHEILGPLGMVATLRLKPLGAYGELAPDATPLVKVRDISGIQNRGPADEDADYSFYPIYISRLGKGKIVGINIAIQELQPADQRSALLLRSIRWLAGRPAS